MCDQLRSGSPNWPAILFEVMATGGRVGFETVAWFNGGLFDDSTALPLEKSDIETVLAASDLDWSEIDPSILGTLFERGLDPAKRAQLGAHYTDRDKIMLLVEPVVIRPLLVEWAAEKTAIAAELDRAEAAKSAAVRTKRRNEAERRLRAFLERLRRFKVLDPACGSGNFLYLALQALKDIEHRVQLEAEALGFQRAFPEVGPANVKGIEINKVRVNRDLAERIILGDVERRLADPRAIRCLFKKTEQALVKLHSAVPKTIRSKTAQLGAERRRLDHLLDFIAEGQVAISANVNTDSGERERRFRRR